MLNVLKSSSYLIFQKFLQRILGLVSTIILARLLTPEDFGLVAIAMLALWFVAAIVDAGTESYILQKKEVSESEINSAWTLDLALKTTALVLLLASSPVIAWLRESEDLLWIISSTGLVLLFATFRNPGLMVLKREQQYELIVKITVLAKIISIIFAIAIALIFRNYWALIVGQIIFEFSVTVLSYKINSHRPNIDISNIHEQWRFSKWLIPKSVLGYFRNHVDTLVVGSFFQSAALGAYNNMKYFSSIPALQIFGPLVEPLHVEMGKVGENVEEFKYQANITIKILAILVAPTVGFMVVSSSELVGLFLGKQWVDYSYLFSVLSLSIVAFIFVSQSFRILMVAFNTKMIFFYELVSTLGLIIALVFTAGYDLYVLVLTKVIVEFLFSAVLYLYTYHKVFHCSGIQNLIGLLISCFCCFLVLMTFDKLIGLENDYFLTILFNGVIASVSGLALFLLYFRFLLSTRERTLISSIMKNAFKFNKN